MTDTAQYRLLSVLLGLPDEQRVAVERELLPFARAGALGELAADIGHDLANPLFAVLGLVELLLHDEETGPRTAARLRLVENAALELKELLHALLDYARPTEGHASASLDAAARKATALVCHGHAKELQVTAAYPPEPVVVGCPADALVQAAFHIVAAARSAAGDAGTIDVEVVADTTHGVLRVRPVPPGGVGIIAAGRIAADHGGSLERDGDSLALRLPLWDQTMAGSALPVAS